MKKGVKNLLIVLFILIVIVICVFAYFYFTKIEGDNISIVENANIYSKESKEAIFTLENYPRVDASTVNQPLTTELMKNFTQQEINEETLNYTKTHQAYVKLINGEADLIVVTEPSKDELELAKEKNVELEVIPVIKDGFVFYVNGKNEVSNLTLEQIQNIYTGKIKKWSEVGGKDTTIRAFQRPENSGSQTGMLSLVMKDKKIMEAPKENLVGTMSEIINLVSDYDNGLNSIGYSYYYYARTMYTTIDEDVANGIKLLKVNGIEPNNDTIKSGEYPLTTSYYIVINKAEPEESNTRKLVNAMLSERGQAIAESVGYVGVK